MSTKKKPKSDAVKTLERITGGPLTLARLLQSIRLGEEVTLAVFAKKLGVSRQHLCDIEKGRKVVSPERAARFALVLGYSKEQFVSLALQALVDDADLDLKVEVKAA
ncbi:MAG: helix-turn-helix domain-containing protein [Bdellovibrionota bacterium]